MGTGGKGGNDFFFDQLLWTGSVLSWDLGAGLFERSLVSYLISTDGEVPG